MRFYIVALLLFSLMGSAAADICSGNMSIAALYYDSGRTSLAASSYQRAAICFEKDKNYYLAYDNYENAANLYLSLGEYDKAVANYINASSNAERVGRLREAGNFYTLAADTEMKKRKSSSDLIFQFYDAAIKDYQDANERKLAISVAEKALNFSIETGNVNASLHYFDKLSSLHALMRDYKSACYYLKEKAVYMEKENEGYEDTADAYFEAARCYLEELENRSLCSENVEKAKAVVLGRNAGLEAFYEAGIANCYKGSRDQLHAYACFKHMRKSAELYEKMGNLSAAADKYKESAECFSLVKDISEMAKSEVKESYLKCISLYSALSYDAQIKGNSNKASQYAELMKACAKGRDDWKAFESFLNNYIYALQTGENISEYDIKTLISNPSSPIAVNKTAEQPVSSQTEKEDYSWLYVSLIVLVLIVVSALYFLLGKKGKKEEIKKKNELDFA